MLHLTRFTRGLTVMALACAALVGTNSHAALFGDDEARKAILDLRQKVDSNSQREADEQRRAAEDMAQLRRSLLDLQAQIEALRAEQANLRGQNEQLTRDIGDLQRRQKDIAQGVDERLRQFEPIQVTVDGKEFAVEPAEKKEYEGALSLFRQGNFQQAQIAFADFIKRNPKSGYLPTSLFWLGNSQYATRDYKEAIANFKSLLSVAPDHLRAPEAALSIANCQSELKDAKANRKTLEDLIKVYPDSEAASAARERLSKMK
jgi:tol-pal system protein YbgF